MSPTKRPALFIPPTSALLLIAFCLIAACDDKSDPDPGTDTAEGKSPCANLSMELKEACLELTHGQGGADKNSGNRGGSPPPATSTFVDLTDLGEELAASPVYGEEFFLFLRLTNGVDGSVQSIGDEAAFALSETGDVEGLSTATLDPDFPAFVALLDEVDPGDLSLELVAADSTLANEVSRVVSYEYTAGEGLDDILLTVSIETQAVAE